MRPTLSQDIEINSIVHLTHILYIKKINELINMYIQVICNTILSGQLWILCI